MSLGAMRRGTGGMRWGGYWGDEWAWIGWLTCGDVIGSLCCESAEEAKTLIPSLTNKISDVDLQDLLDEISKLRNFTEG